MFVPVVPLFVEEPSDAEQAQATLTPGEVASFLAEQVRSLEQKISTVTSTLPADTSAVISGAEARVCITLSHVCDIVGALGQGVDYIEHMLRQQLYAAVGKQISSADFVAFNRFQNCKLFREDMQPLPFFLRRAALRSARWLG